MNDLTPAWLALESGLVMAGRAVGARGERGGDLVFNTAMSGYHEILTDPSYRGQVVLMTYPQIGNYGVPEVDAESNRAWAEAFVIKEMSPLASNFRSNLPLSSWLEREGVVAIDGIDTRKLTKHVRERGSLRCVVSTEDGDPASLVAKARATPSTDGRDLASEVCTKSPYRWSEGFEADLGWGSYPIEVPPVSDKRRARLVAFDFGIKRNILRSLVHAGFDLTVVPAWTPAAEVLAHDPEAIFLSNGPGDPAAVQRGIAAVSDLVGKRPIFGICLGHQILSIVLGGRTQKMPFGHHGANHPVRDLLTKRVEITSQNHSFAVDAASLPAGVELTHINLNDGTVEGLMHRTARVSCVQYHPEAAPGPLDSSHLFRRFAESVRA